MPITINGSGTITGISAGGLPDASITASDLASGASLTNIGTSSITQAYLAPGVSGTGPTFSAYSSAGQTLSANTFTKLQFNTEEFDTASCYDNATNYRFTPNVAGYYQAGGGFGGGATQCTTIVAIYKNGSNIKTLANSPSVNPGSYGSALVYLNGTTDYIELYGVLSVGQVTASGANGMFFQAVMVRSA
jgi:hypothetical protein